MSRQREFLADAAASQFTRDPIGLADALRKIGGLAPGSRLASPHAEQASHLFFGNGSCRHLFSWLETHPPLDQRIRRLDPPFDGTFPKIAAKPHSERAARAAQAKTLASASAAKMATAAAAVQMLRAEAAVASVGNPTPAHVAYAAALRERLPATLVERVREPASARAVVRALLLSRDSLAVAAQLVALAEPTGDPRLLEEVHAVMPAAECGPREVDASLRELDAAAPRRKQDLLLACAVLIAHDRRVTVEEGDLLRALADALQCPMPPLLPGESLAPPDPRPNREQARAAPRHRDRDRDRRASPSALPPHAAAPLRRSPSRRA